MLMNVSIDQRLEFLERIGAGRLCYQKYTWWRMLQGIPEKQALLKATLPAIYTAYQLQAREDRSKS